MGPQADEKQAAAVGKYLDIGTEYGRAIVGGKRATEAGVNFIQPTVFTGLSDQSRLNTEEIFGPVMVMHEFDTEEEAVHRANDTECELQMSYQVYSSLLSAC
jgi:aldehyde dehydrogenase (NAD+)